MTLLCITNFVYQQYLNENYTLTSTPQVQSVTCCLYTIIICFPKIVPLTFNIVYLEPWHGAGQRSEVNGRVQNSQYGIT